MRNQSTLAAVGDITEYPLPTAISGPFGIAAGPDGNLWFTEESANMVAKVTTSGAVTEYPVPTANSAASGIAAGPDGNLWFTESSANKVGKVTTAGVFTEYPIPTPASGSSGIAAGPDGNLWFIETQSNKVAKVSVSGVFTEYPVPTANSWPSDIAVGPDGNLWVTEATANKVAKVTTSGVFTEYPGPNYPVYITAGPDGNLWITSTVTFHVAKVTTVGVFTEYSNPTDSGSPGSIAAGPDGNLWFTEIESSKVAKVTTSGIFTEYHVPTASSAPLDIAAGPDGNLWFTEFSASKVAKIVAAMPVLGPSSTYNPMSPLRVLDTRSSGQTLNDGSSLTLQLRGSSVPSSATAVAVNVTVTNSSAAGFLTLYPTGATLPLASSLNWTTGETVANLVHVALGATGQITIYCCGLQGYATSIDVVVDLEGYFAPSSGGTAGEFVPLPPNRITDTRPGSGWPNAGSTLGEGGSLDVQVTGAGGVPAASVEAVVLNATVTDTTGTGFLTAYPRGSGLPLASNLNWTPGTSVPNRLIVPVGTGGMVSFFNSSGSIDLVVDVNGYFTDSTASGSSFVPLTPARILDTRDGTGGFSSQVGQGGTIAVSVAGLGGVPLMSAATPPTAVVMNVTATNPSAAGFLTVWPDLLTQPPASDLNFLPGQSVPNLVVVKVGADGKVDVYNGWGSTDVIFDVVGWYG